MGNNNAKKLKKLSSVCEKFIKDNRISCAESIMQQDYIIENAYELIEEICDILGYHKYNDEDE